MSTDHLQRILACRWIVAIGIAAALGASACDKKEPGPSEAPPPAAESAPQDPRLAKAMEEIAKFRARVEQNPKDVEALAELGNVNLALGRPDHAKEWYDRALEVDPNRSATRIDLAIALRNLQKPDEAIAQLKQVLAKEPKNAAALYNLGIILLEDKQDQPAAIARWEAMMKAHPDDPRVPQLRQVVEGLKHPSAAAPPADQPPAGG
jgi:cytochrome c-type biogenesis protein CcmH/NrfG